MERQRGCVYRLGLAALLTLFPSPVRGEDVESKSRPSVASIADEEAAGGTQSAPATYSPYANWPDQGMRPLADLAEPQSEIFPDQAAAIAATFGAEPWRCEGHSRAGWPACVHSRAFPSDTGRYGGYYVGGGNASRYEGRFQHEGTWGWDYLGHWLPKRVALGWSHSRRQSGTGTYATDGPRVIRH